MIRLLLSFFILVFFMACNTPKSFHVKHVRQMEAEAGQTGFYYALPRTVLSFDVTIYKTKEIPGPFAEYAGTYLGLDDVIKKSSVEHKITEININSYAEPDPRQFYFVKYDPEVFEEKPFYISLTESGLLQSVNTDFDSEEFMQALDKRKKEYGYFGTEDTFNYFMDTNLEEKVDTIVEMVVKDTILEERQILQRSWVEKDEETKAEEVADFILKIRDQKMDLVTGFHEIPYSKETIEFMYSKLSKEEENYLELFTGLKSTSKIKYRFTHIPEKEQAGKKRPLFRFCEEEGVIPIAERNKGSLVTIELKRNQTTRQPEVFINRNIDPEKDKDGFFYRIPEHATVTIQKDGKIKADARFLISQFGTIATLPPEHFEIEFYPNTGFIKSIRKIENKEE